MKESTDHFSIRNTIVSGLSGTTAMTAFSYLVSEKQGRYFKEPEILNDLVYRLMPVRKGNDEPIAGFIAHYVTGLTFSAIYHVFFKKRSPVWELGKGIACGLAFGLAGIGIWKAVFKLHPDPPAVHLADFFGHLIAAHLIFGTTMAGTTAMLNKEVRDGAILPHSNTGKVLRQCIRGSLPPHSRSLSAAT